MNPAPIKIKRSSRRLYDLFFSRIYSRIDAGPEGGAVQLSRGVSFATLSSFWASVLSEIIYLWHYLFDRVFWYDEYKKKLQIIAYVSGIS